MKKLLLFDANALLHRAYHALPPLTDKKGRLVNALYGFTSSILSALKNFQPQYVAVAFDSPGKTYRHKEYKEYKATRPKYDEAFYKQIPLAQHLLEVFNVPVFARQGYEADDIIAAIKVKSEKLKVKTIIATGDLDTLQLVDENASVWNLGRGEKQAILYDPQKVHERYGLKPSQIVDFKALKGDPSDNIKGLPGIGDKGAQSLLAQFGSLFNLYKNLNKVENEKIRKVLQDNKKLAFANQKLVKLQTDWPEHLDLSACKLKDYDKAKLTKHLEEFGFKSLIKRLPEAQPKSQNTLF